MLMFLCPDGPAYFVLYEKFQKGIRQHFEIKEISNQTAHFKC